MIFERVEFLFLVDFSLFIVDWIFFVVFESFDRIELLDMSDFDVFELFCIVCIVVCIWVFVFVYRGFDRILLCVFLNVLNLIVKEIVLFKVDGCVNCMYFFILRLLRLFIYWLMIKFLWLNIGIFGKVWFVNWLSVYL